MFVRVKSTPNSPRKSVQIVTSVRKSDKVTQKIVRHVGIAMDDSELKQLKMLAESIKIKLEAADQQLLFAPEELAKMMKNSDSSDSAKRAKTSQKENEGKNDYKVNLKDLVEEDRVVSGIHDIYGNLFDELGYNRVLSQPVRHKLSTDYFKNIVLARLATPLSKRGSVEMLQESFGVTLDLDKVYRMMDKLDDSAIERLNEITYKNTLSLFAEKIDVIFFDCTTIYFESFTEDEFRRNGYSKDLKFNQPQVLLALMVTKAGLPIGYEAFDGSQYEGHTLIPLVRKLRKKYNLDKVVFVADSGMFNKENLQEIESMREDKIEYIVGSRLKSLPKELKEKVLELSNYEVISSEYKIGRFDFNGRKLIVSYSGKRARKDCHDREKAIMNLQQKLDKTKNPKYFLTNYGYKKFLKTEGKTTFAIDEEKILQASRWDGLHGVVTNAEDLSNDEILVQYNNLWNIEYAFRITKNDLRVRPIFHWKEQRVKAHLAISYATFSLVKFMEYRIKLQYKKLSPEKIKNTLLRVQTSVLFDKKKKIRYGLPSKISETAKKIYQVMRVNRDRTPFIIKKCSA